MANQFYRLQIKDIVKTTPDCSVISFEIADDVKNVFEFKQGQHLTLKAEINGEEQRRSYSLCSAPSDKEWKVAVKKIDGGVFSGFANDQLKSGDYLEVMPPHGNFFTETNPELNKNYVAFAAGSGITPILSIIKTHLLLEPKSTFQLFYINQTVASVILKEEIEALKNQYFNRFEVFFFLTQEERDIQLFNGRIDEAKLELIAKHLLDIENTDNFFICGPEEMIFTIKDFLIQKGTDPKKVHFELFNTGVGLKRAKPKADLQAFTGKMCDVTVIEGGKNFKFKMAQGSGNILDAALKKGADLPFACKGGVCCTCKAKLMEGQINMEVNYALEQEQLDAGYVLTCQSVPVSEKVIVDFDQ